MRLIDADELLEIVEKRYLSACVQAAQGTRRKGKSIHYGIAIGMNFVRNVINEQPTIEAEPVRHGRWIDGMPYTGSHWKVCSKCHKSADHPAGGHEYCGHCGAKMDGGAEDGTDA